jgi:hypothetical protein
MGSEIKSFSATLGTETTPDGREVKIISVRIEDEAGVVVETNAVLPVQGGWGLDIQEQNFKEAFKEAVTRAFEVMKDKSNILPRFA